jgi:guanylate kinase
MEVCLSLPSLIIFLYLFPQALFTKFTTLDKGWWESQGVKQVKKTDLQLSIPLTAFYSCSGATVTGRGTETDESLQKRLEQAEREIEFSREEGVHDMVIVNNDLDTAYREVEAWIVNGEKFEKAGGVGK